MLIQKHEKGGEPVRDIYATRAGRSIDFTVLSCLEKNNMEFWINLGALVPDNQKTLYSKEIRAQRGLPSQKPLTYQQTIPKLGGCALYNSPYCRSLPAKNSLGSIVQCQSHLQSS
jgi:hypothetical protein